MSHKSSLKNRRQEEHEMQEMTGSRQTRFLAAHTHFNEKEVESLQHMYHLFTQNEKPPFLFKLKFREIFQKHFGISGDAMLDQIFHYFDADHVGHISCTEWVRNLSTVLRGTFDEQTKFCFDIYDLKGEGAIGKNEVLTLLQDCLIPVPGVEAEMTDVTNIREIADLLFKKLDRDKTGHITLPDFRFAVRRDPTSLQCLGNCLPDPRDVKAFMALMCTDYNDFKTNYSVPGMSSFGYERDRFNAPAMFPYKMMGAVKKAKTVVQIMQHLVSKGGKEAFTTVAANNMRLAASKLLRGEHHIHQSL
jgi:Ca2+-binding EF-hand superfamily protein